MKQNLIILTGGLSGSSVLAGLINKAGYWLGTKTTKVKYDTFENSKLVELNIKLFRNSGYFWRGVDDIPPPSAELILKKANSLDLLIFNQFPSGLNLYYTMFNVLTIIQQKFIDTDKPAVQPAQKK